MTPRTTSAAALVLAGALGLAVASDARAGRLTVHVGPPSIGMGGPNPISIPPINPVEYEVIYVTDKDTEWNFAATPGLLYGTRSETASGIYVAFGGGLVLSINGTGPGVYSSFGLNLGDRVKFNAEFKQAVGFDFSADAMISPYAIRVGATFEL